MAKKKHAAIRGASQPTINDEINCIFDARLALEGQRAKVNSMVGALAILADDRDQAPLFFTLMNALEPVDTELERIIERMAALEKPAGKAVQS